MSTRIVTARWVTGTGAPYAFAPAVFEMDPASFTTEDFVETAPLTVLADANGEMAQELFTNAETLEPTRWIVTWPSGRQDAFVLPPGEGPISLRDLLGLNLPGWRDPGQSAIDIAIEGVYQAFANTSDITLGDALVGTRAPHTGAVGRTLHQRLQDRYHVADWGAAPGASAAANDTGMAAALAALELAGGGTLHLAAGTYQLATRLVIPDGVTLAGATRGATILDFSGAPDGTFDPEPGIEYACCIAVLGGGPTQLPALASDVAKNAFSITFSEDMSAVLSPGNVLKIHDPTLHSYSWFRAYYYAGEFAYVLSVAGAVVTLSRPTIAGYTASVVDVYLCDFAQVTLRDLTILGKQEPDPATDPAVVYFSYATGRLLVDVELYGTDFAHCLVQQCTEFTIESVRVRYFSAFGGTNYGINVNNSQNGDITNCHIAVTRHALTHGGSHAQGVPTRYIRVAGGYYEGRGENTNGSIAYHGNCEHNTIEGVHVVNGITWSGNHNTVRDTRIQTGWANVAIGGSEIAGADHVFDGVSIEVMADLVNDVGSSQGAIDLSFMSGMSTGGTVCIHNVHINMNGFKGEPIECYNITEETINVDVKNLTVVNANRAAGTSLIYFRTGAGHKYGTMLFADCTVSGVDLRLEGCGPSLARWVNYVAMNPSSNGISVLPNDLIQSTYQHRATENGVPRKLAVIVDDFGNPILETRTFQLQQAGDALYFSYSVPFSNVHVVLAQYNTAPATGTWEYWNGAWTALPGISDTMVSGGAPLAVAGTIAWTIPGDWAKSYLDYDDPAHPEYNETSGHARLYWIRMRTSGELTVAELSTMETQNLTQPVTEESFELIDAHIRGASAAGAFINATSKTFSTLRVVGGDLTNNGSVVGGGDSSKCSIYMGRLLWSEINGTLLGDSRSPAGSTTPDLPSSRFLYACDEITSLDVRRVKNINPAGMVAVSEPGTVARYHAAARAYRTTSLSPANVTWTAVSLIGETYDDVMHDPAVNPSRISFRESGMYSIVGAVSFAINATGNRGVRLRVGGATTIAQTLVPACTGAVDTTDIIVAAQRVFLAGEYVELQVYQSSGAALGVVLNSDYANALMVARI